MKSKQEIIENLQFIGFIILIIFGFVVFVKINHNMETNCINTGGKAIYTNYGLYEKCIK